MSGIEEVEVVAYVGCESRMTREGHENGDEYLVFADMASDADKRYKCPLMTVAQHNRIVEQYKLDAERWAWYRLGFDDPEQLDKNVDDSMRSDALSTQPDRGSDKLGMAGHERIEIPQLWSGSLCDCWPEDEEYPEENWIIGNIDEDGHKYPVITVEAYQYDAEGHSEQIAKAIIALWAAVQQAEVKI